MVPFQNFMGFVYAQQVQRDEEDQIRWSLDHNGQFAVKSYHKVLAGRRAQPFPWKPIWKSKVPPRVAFFVWTAAKGKILTMDNLRKRGICIVEWCCLCKKSGESPEHLLLHCSYAQALWSFAFSLFGISWVMPAQITDLLTSWMGGFGKSRAALVWGEVPHCVMWLLWHECNHRVFEGQEVTSLDLKSSFLKTLYEWVSITISPAISSYEEFLDSCYLS